MFSQKVFKNNAKTLEEEIMVSLCYQNEYKCAFSKRESHLPKQLNRHRFYAIIIDLGNKNKRFDPRHTYNSLFLIRLMTLAMHQ